MLHCSLSTSSLLVFLMASFIVRHSSWAGVIARIVGMGHPKDAMRGCGSEMERRTTAVDTLPAVG